MKRIALILLLILGALFYKSFFTFDYVPFSNDGPLGAHVAAKSKVPDSFFGAWDDLNWVGNAAVSQPVTSISAGFKVICWYIPYTALPILYIACVLILVFCKTPKNFEHVCRRYFFCVAFTLPAAVLICCLLLPKEYEVVQAILALEGCVAMSAAMAYMISELPPYPS